MDNILKVAKRLKIFTLEDIVMFCEIDADTAEKFIQDSENIKPFGNKFEYVETTRVENKFRIINKNIQCKNSDITVVAACEIFLENCKNRNIKINTIKAYNTFINAHITPYFKNILLKNITVADVEKFTNYLRNNNVPDRRIKNILTLLNQIIKYFQKEGYIEKNCVFQVKRLEKIPKREVQILSVQQLKQLFKITKKKYPYLLTIIQKVITLKQPLNTILTGGEQEKESLKRKIRKDFYKIKKELGLSNYMFDDLRFIKC